MTIRVMNSTEVAAPDHTRAERFVKMSDVGMGNAKIFWFSLNLLPYLDRQQAGK